MSEAKCSCQHCNGHIAFPAEMAGQMFACPHCGLETKLYVANVSKAPGSNPPQNVSVEIKRGVSPLGIASLVLGIIACIFCVVPLLANWAINLGMIGVALSLAGVLIATKNKKTGFEYPISGGIVSLLSIFIALVMTYGFWLPIYEAISVVHIPTFTETKQARPKPQREESDHSWSFQQGNINGKIDDIILGFNMAESPTERGLIVKTRDFLLIKVSVMNTSSNRICDYTTFRDNAILTDDNGNNYHKLVRFANRPLNVTIEEFGRVTDGWMPPNAEWNGWLTRPFYPNSSRMRPHTGRDEMLGFEIPDSPGKVLHLELSAENFGGTGKIKFEIPATGIKNW